MNNEGYEIRWVQNTCDRLAILTVMEPQRHLTLLPANNGPLSTGKVIRYKPRTKFGHFGFGSRS